MPEWVLNKCEQKGTPVTEIIKGSKPHHTALKAIWEPCPKQELIKYIKEFVRYKNDPAFRYAYVTFFNDGEFYMTEAQWYDAIDKGLTPTKLWELCKDYLDAWDYALGGDKLIWLKQTANSPPTQGLRDAQDRCNEYAINTIGANLRAGLGHPAVFIVSDTENVPFAWDENGYQKYFTIHDLGNNGMSLLLSEYTECESGLMNIVNDFPYYRITMLNLMRAGLSHGIFCEEVRDTDVVYIKMFRDYFRQTGGYPINEAPDAWAALLKYSTKYGCCGSDPAPPAPIKWQNYEKFLIQREIPGGKTVPVEQIDTGDYGYYGRDLILYTARRTDHANGSDYIYFNLDDNFLSSSEHAIEISVYYKDNNTANWQIQYNSQSGDYTPTASVTNTNDGQWKSARFTIKNTSFRNAQTGGQDFRIFNGGSQDITVSSVRVIRL